MVSNKYAAMKMRVTTLCNIKKSPATTKKAIAFLISIKSQKILKPAIIASETGSLFGSPGYLAWPPIVKVSFKPKFVTKVKFEGLSALII